ncbi:MAG: hypothetical protein MJZ75_07315 [Paludibacteraceae bacterium]|nr:hypothetical protein [Paludibacteraceae bacterium]
MQDKVDDLALHRRLYAALSDDDWRFVLQQVDGYQRTKDKLPTFANMNTVEGENGWWYPVRLSCEQCSSEVTARYKAKVAESQKSKAERQHLIDLTGGAGVDTYFMSEVFHQVDYIEQNADLCALAKHNLPNRVKIHNTTAEDFLSQLTTHDAQRTVLYADPARRDKNGGKVFRIEDCTPNVIELLPRMRQVADTIMIKLSPMLDISAALRSLGGNWQVHIVAVHNEVKEILLVSHSETDITAVDLADGITFRFTREEEEQAAVAYSDNTALEGMYLYEPNAAIIKAGAYKLVGQRYDLRKLDVNTHLYVSPNTVDDFAGRKWRILHAPCTMQEVQKGQYNVLTRNYVMGAEEWKKRWKVRDGGTLYLIGARQGNKPVALLCEKIE